jgi:hypothetical protein
MELADLGREWLGRVNAMILRPAVGQAVLAFCCRIITVPIPPVEPGATAVTWSGGRIQIVGAITALICNATAWAGEDLAINSDVRLEARSLGSCASLFTNDTLHPFRRLFIRRMWCGVLQSVLAHLQIIANHGPVENNLNGFRQALQVVVAATLSWA